MYVLVYLFIATIFFNPSIQFDIQGEIEKVKVNGGIVNIPQGIYTLSTGLLIYNAKNVIVNGNNSTLIISSLTQNAITIASATGIVINNLQIDYNPLPFTQGVVTRIDTTNYAWFEVLIDSGYSTNAAAFGQGSFVQIFDSATRRFKQEGFTITGSVTSTSITGNVMRVNVNNGMVLFSNVQVNDLVSIGVPSEVSFKCVFNLYYAQNTNINGVTVYSSPACGVLENGGGGTVIDGMQIRRGFIPVGATQPRLMSINRDGFHINGPREGTIIKNCYAEFIGDDAVNVRGAFGTITSVNTLTNTIKFTPSYMNFDSQTDLRIYGGIKLNDKGSTNVVSHIPNSDTAVVSKTDFLNIGDKFVSRQHARGFKIVNNTFRDIDARGILATGSDILIAGNTIERTTYSGIWVGAETFYYQEGDFANNVLIARNNLIDCGYTWRGRFSQQQLLGAITIANEIDPAKVNDLKYVRQNQNTMIVENLIQRSGLAGIYVASMKNASICRNQLVQTNNLDPRNAGSLLNLSSRYGIRIHDSERINTYSNTIALGPYGLDKQSVTDSDNIAESTSNPCLSNNLCDGNEYCSFN